MKNEVIVLGGGVGGLPVANRLVRARSDIRVTLIDSHGDHVYQAGSMNVALDGARADRLRRDTRDLLDPRVTLRVDKAVELDRAGRRLGLDSGERVPYDVLVVATGSQVDRPAVPPGAREGAYHFHCPRSAESLARAITTFPGGHIVIGATRLPYKCPPSPIEFALRLDAQLRRRGLRKASRMTYIYPMPAVYPEPRIASWAAQLMTSRGIQMVVPFVVQHVDPSHRRVVSETGIEIPYDLLVLVPPHGGAPFVRACGLADASGWIPVNHRTLNAGGGIYSLGDAAGLPIPKTGSAARLQAATVADNILRQLDGMPPRAGYDGSFT